MQHRQRTKRNTVTESKNITAEPLSQVSLLLNFERLSWIIHVVSRSCNPRKCRISWIGLHCELSVLNIFIDVSVYRVIQKMHNIRCRQHLMHKVIKEDNTTSITVQQLWSFLRNSELLEWHFSWHKYNFKILTRSTDTFHLLSAIKMQATQILNSINKIAEKPKSVWASRRGGVIYRWANLQFKRQAEGRTVLSSRGWQFLNWKKFTTRSA